MLYIGWTQGYWAVWTRLVHKPWNLTLNEKFLSNSEHAKFCRHAIHFTQLTIITTRWKPRKYFQFCVPELYSFNTVQKNLFSLLLIKLNTPPSFLSFFPLKGNPIFFNREPDATHLPLKQWSRGWTAWATNVS